MIYEAPKLKEFATMEFQDGIMLFSADHPKGKLYKNDAELLAAILDLQIPRLEDQAA